MFSGLLRLSLYTAIASFGLQEHSAEKLPGIHRGEYSVRYKNKFCILRIEITGRVFFLRLGQKKSRPPFEGRDNLVRKNYRTNPLVSFFALPFALRATITPSGSVKRRSERSPLTTLSEGAGGFL